MSLKEYDGGTWQTARTEFEAYAAATDDPNPAYRGEGAVAPPMYHVRPFIGLMMDLARDPELDLDMLRLVHGEHGMRFHRLLRDGEALKLRATLTSLEEKASGRVASFGLFGSVGDELVLEGRTVYFVRAAKRADGPKKPKPPAEPLPEPTWTAPQPVSADQAARYAEASGDHNPIHLDTSVAQKAGLPSVILHGLCTLAFAQRDIIQRTCGGDPSRLASLSVRFARPVFPGETLTLEVWEGEASEKLLPVRFLTKNADGKPVLTHGLAEVRT